MHSQSPPGQVGGALGGDDPLLPSFLPSPHGRCWGFGWAQCELSLGPGISSGRPPCAGP